ncbi:hypothetical protein RvY_14548 [Ramazzottius varieornatus]|uniref:Uncharacterized protein n=1 Tax=Ramazzottius varieornatus TaxID=947166 RepID=A0A1D1VWT0_RAMVA|nr:hypothetical protein RvY_14548 [Ramazzottius varieornatus]
MSTGNKATAPLYSVGDKDTSDGAEEHAQDVRAKLKTSKAAKKAAIARACRKALVKDGTAEEQQFPEAFGLPAQPLVCCSVLGKIFIKVNDASSSALPSITTRRIRAADLLQTYNTTASQIEAIHDLDKIKRQIDMEERKNDREWQQERFAKEQELKDKQLEIEKEIRLTEVKERAEYRQIRFQTITTLRNV